MDILDRIYQRIKEYKKDSNNISEIYLNDEDYQDLMSVIPDDIRGYALYFGDVRIRILQ